MTTSSSTHCEYCGDRFGILSTWKYKCENCNRNFCLKCFEDIPKTKYLSVNPFSDIKTSGTFLAYGEVCKYCYEEEIVPIIEKYEEAKKLSEEIEIFSSNYKGSIPYRSSADKKKLKTSFWKDREDTKRELRVTAAYFGFDLIYDREWHKDTRSKPSNSGDGTYKYSVWSASAIATARK